MIIERRFHPRVEVSFPVQITFIDDVIALTGEAINLALSGMQIQVSKTVADSIMSKNPYPPEFLLSIDIPDLKLDHLNARVIVNRRISEQHFQLGIKLFNLEEAQLNSLQKFIDNIKTKKDGA
jgi:hypothetical protein